MITQCKDILQGVVELAGVPAERVARSQKTASELKQKSQYPYCKILTGTGRFEDTESMFSQIPTTEDGKAVRYYKQLRTQRIMPFVVHFFDVNEEACTGLVDVFIANLPFYWEYKLMQGTVVPKSEEHSDFAANMNNRYESAILCEFRVAVGPDAEAGKSIQAVDQGE